MHFKYWLTDYNSLFILKWLYYFKILPETISMNDTNNYFIIIIQVVSLSSLTCFSLSL